MAIPYTKCKFCGCTDDRPCLIHMARRHSELALDPQDDEVVIGDFPCAWLLPDVCTAPACVDKAYLEFRPLAEVIHFGNEAALALVEAA